MRDFLRIAVWNSTAVLLYGTTHNALGAWFSPAYFTVAHGSIAGLQHPLVLAIVWGLATVWPVAAACGAGTALAGRVGKWPRLTAPEVLPTTIIALACIGVLSFLAGLASYYTARATGATLPRFLDTVPATDHAALWACRQAHMAMYPLLFVATVALVGRILWRRWRLRRERAESWTAPPLEH